MLFCVVLCYVVLRCVVLCCQLDCFYILADRPNRNNQMSFKMKYWSFAVDSNTPGELNVIKSVNTSSYMVDRGDVTR